MISSIWAASPINGLAAQERRNLGIGGAVFLAGGHRFTACRGGRHGGEGLLWPVCR
jgi:hypothetical protein